MLIGYSDPSRPFQTNKETILCSKKVMDAASGSAAPMLRYFCSQAHCEEGKENHEVTMKEYNLELVRKENDLNRKARELTAAYDHVGKQNKEWGQNLDEPKA